MSSAAPQAPESGDAPAAPAIAPGTSPLVGAPAASSGEATSDDLPRPLTPIEAELESAEVAGEVEAAEQTAAVAQPAGNGAEPAGDEDVPAGVAAEAFAAAPATAAAAARAAGTVGRTSSLPPTPPDGPAGGLPSPPPVRPIRRPAAPVSPPRRGIGAAAGGRPGAAEARLEELGSRSEGSSSSARIAILAIVGVAAVVLVVLFVVLHGSGSSSPTAATASSHSSSAVTHGTAHHSSAAPASNPATLAVVVLNGTGVNGLAHHLAGDLTQNGYNNATPQSANPGSTATTTVYYATGDRTDANGVAQVLGVSAVAPITAPIRSISGSAPVVVVAGMDQAASVGGATTGGSGTGATG